MRFHMPSFLAGAAIGASSAALAPRLRPIAVEIAADCYRVFDAMMLRVARGREDIADLFAEARAIARNHLPKRPHLREVA